MVLNTTTPGTLKGSGAVFFRVFLEADDAYSRYAALQLEVHTNESQSSFQTKIRRTDAPFEQVIFLSISFPQHLPPILYSAWGGGQCHC